METLGISLGPARAMLLQIGAFMPRLLGAALVVLVGWLLAKAARFAVGRALRAFNFHVLTERAGLDNFLRQGGSRADTTDLFAWLVYWLVIIAAVTMALNGLGFGYLAELLARVIWFLPRVFVALLVLALGSYFAQFVGETSAAWLRSNGVQDASVLGKVAQWAVMLFVLLVVLDLINVGGAIVFYSFLLILGGVVLAFALAFGLGGRDWAAQRLEHWWPSPRRRAQSADLVDLAERRPPPDNFG